MERRNGQSIARDSLSNKRFHLSFIQILLQIVVQLSFGERVDEEMLSVVLSVIVW